MALRDIITKEDPLLRKHSREVTDFGDKTGALIDDLMETVVKAEGLGLAAPQVGILRRVVVIYDNEKFVPLINPEILSTEGEVYGVEGCLSCPGESGHVTRPQKVTVRAYDRTGKQFESEYVDMAARAACHEIDHLNGRLFIDISEDVADDDDDDDMPENDK